MKKIDFYIIKKFLGTFFLSISLIIIIVIIFDLSENIDDMLSSEAPTSAIIFDYYLNFIPYFVNLFSPLFTFIAVIYFTSKMASQSEIISILGNGINFYRMLRPFIITAAFLGVLSFYLSNFLIPYTNKNKLKFENLYLNDKYHNNNKNIHMQIAQGTYIYVESYAIDENLGIRFSMEKYNNNLMFYKLTAQSILWDSIQQKWKLNNYTKRTFDGITESVICGQKMDTAINLSPKDFYKKTENMALMNFWQLRKFINDEKSKGAENIKVYEVEKHKRIANPFSTFILTVIGVAVSSRKVRGGIGANIAFGLALTFLYILLSRIAETFATYSDLSPFIAAWVTNILFVFVATYLIIRAPK
jgi:lipopolysaccharide export system permease protein